MQSNALFAASRLFFATLGVGVIVSCTTVTRESLKRWKAAKISIEQRKLAEFKRRRSEGQ